MKLNVIIKDQFLLYVRRKKGVRKNWIIYILKMGFILLNKKNELLFKYQRNMQLKI